MTACQCRTHAHGAVEPASCQKLELAPGALRAINDCVHGLPSCRASGAHWVTQLHAMAAVATGLLCPNRLKVGLLDNEVRLLCFAAFSSPRHACPRPSPC